MHSALVGGTHQEAPAPAGGDPLPGPSPAFFFAPEHFAAPASVHGAGSLAQQLETSMLRFIADSSWLEIDRQHGPESLTEAYSAILQGTAAPATAHIMFPR